MNMLKQLNASIEYIEANLCAEINLDIAASIACVTADSFIRFMDMRVHRHFQELLQNSMVLHRQFIAEVVVRLRYIHLLPFKLL